MGAVRRAESCQSRAIIPYWLPKDALFRNEEGRTTMSRQGERGA